MGLFIGHVYFRPREGTSSESNELPPGGVAEGDRAEGTPARQHPKASFFPYLKTTV